MSPIALIIAVPTQQYSSQQGAYPQYSQYAAPQQHGNGNPYAGTPSYTGVAPGYHPGAGTVVQAVVVHPGNGYNPQPGYNNGVPPTANVHMDMGGGSQGYSPPYQPTPMQQGHPALYSQYQQVHPNQYQKKKMYANGHVHEMRKHVPYGL